MTSTSQSDPANPSPDSLSGKQEGAAQETRQVPLDALAASRQKARTAEERVAELEARLAKFEKQTGEERVAQPGQGVDEELRQQVAEIRERERLRELTSELGLATSAQAKVVNQLLAKNPDLSPTEALTLAAQRQPDAFGDLGARGFDPNTHGGLRPASGRSPQTETDREARLKAMKEAPGVRRKELVANYIGSLAAKALGMSDRHTKLPL